MSLEKFRKWNFSGKLSVRYGVDKLWTADQPILLNQINAIIKDFMSQNITLTNRQLYYQLVAGDIIPNAVEVYKRICKFLTDGRYAGLIDWEAIEDRGRVPERHSQWSSVKILIASAVYGYRLPRWKDQDFYVELYCEKQAMESVLKPIAEEYHIFFGYNKGYSSASTMYDLANRLREQIQNGKKAIVLYLGDHDASGLDMVRDIRDRIAEFLTEGDDPIECEDEIEEKFNIVPLALNMEQIKRYKCPPNPAKITDPRAKEYIKQFGNISWELDALKPQVLMNIARAGVERYIDMDKYNAWIEKENEQKQALKKFGEKLAGKDGDDDDE